MTGTPVRRPQTTVVHHQRLPFPDHHSVERVFDAVRSALPDHLDAVAAVAPATSKGLWPRIRSALAARRWRGDVHHITGDVTYLGLLLPRARTVVTIHDCEFLDRASGLKALVYRIVWLQLPVLHARVVTVISPETEHRLRAAVWLQPKDVRVVPDPLPPTFGPVPAEQHEVPVVLQVGVRPNKGLDVVADAVRGTGWRLRVIGVLDDQQQALLRGLDTEQLSGLSAADLVRAYAGADVLAFCSTHEGFGMPVIEAQAVGRPVVTADREPLPWVAGAGGAVHVDPTDSAAVRAALDRVLSDPSLRRDLVDAGTANVARFTPERVAALYAAIYDELVAR